MDCINRPVLFIKGLLVAATVGDPVASCIGEPFGMLVVGQRPVMGVDTLDDCTDEITEEDSSSGRA